MANDMTARSRPGRAFEELITRIEQTLAPSGAIIKSPDYIKDRVTKRLREVDASIRIPDAGSTRLITVECRDHRKGRQDDRWIEQLVTKKDKIGAFRTIAVSSTGFSNSAIASARHFGIDLRQLDQITDAEIAQEWAAVSAFKMAIIRVDYFAFEIAVFDSNGEPITGDDLPVDMLESLRADLTNTKFLSKSGVPELISAADLSHLFDGPRDELKEDGDPIRLRATCDFSHGNWGEWFIDTVTGPKALSRVEICYEFNKRSLPAAIDSVKQYRSPDKPILEQSTA